MNPDSAATFSKSKKQLLHNWMTNQRQDPALRDDLMSLADLEKQSEQLLDSLLPALGQTESGKELEVALAPVQDTLREISVDRARKGFSARETSAYILSLKEVLGQSLQEKFQAQPQLLIQEIASLNKLLDALALDTVETFLKGREDIITRQTDEMNEISTPVIRVWDGILALPIIGTLDSARTQVVMEALLQEIVDTSSRIAILDISGVPTVDSLVAQHLIKTVSAARLMGAECIISGIRPEIAQTIVHLGIDLTNIHTKASLASALKLSFSMLNLRVVRGGQAEPSGSKATTFGF